MRISVYEPAQDRFGKAVPGWRPIPVDLSWSGLCKLLSSPVKTACAPCPPKDCPHKLGRAWSPVDMEGHRRNENARTIACAVIDLDHCPPDKFGAMVSRLEGYECVIHSTHSHRPWDWCLRLVLPFTDLIPAAEWAGVWRTIVDIFDLPRDEQCKDPSRVYFLPTHVEGGEFFFIHGEGIFLDSAELMQIARERIYAPHAQPVSESQHDMPSAGLEDLPDIISIDLIALTDRLKEVRYRKSRSVDPWDQIRYEVLNRILKGGALALPGRLSESESARMGLPLGRDGAINQAMSIIACCLPAGTPVEAAIEILRPSIYAMDCSPEGTDHFIGRAKYSYVRAMERRLKRDREAEALDEALRVRLAGMLPTPQGIAASQLQASVGAPQSLRAQMPAGIVPVAPAIDPYASWRDYIILKKDGTRKLVGENAFTILAFGEQTRNTFRWNLVDKSIEVTGGPFKDTPSAVLDIVVTDWLTRFWELPLTISEVANRILRLAYNNSYDPLAQYLNSLSWDGYNRVDDWLVRYCNARTVDIADRQIQHHVNDVGRKWMISAVARALNPGCKVDTVLIIEGEQGDYKSQMLEILGGKWYCGDSLEIGSDDSKAISAKNWIIEIPEMDSFLTSEDRTRKKFFSGREDQYRVPYAKYPEKFKRRSVYVGTYNPRDNEAYFKDPSGNRRYWPIRLGAQINLAEIERDRDHLWAQAVYYYRQYCELDRQGVLKELNPYRWWYNQAEQAEVEKQTQDRMSPSVAQIKIAEWWSGMHPSKRPLEFSTVWIAENVLQYPADRINQSVSTIVGSALRAMGFGKRRKSIGNWQEWVYVPTEEQRDMPLGNKPRLQLITDELRTVLR